MASLKRERQRINRYFKRCAMPQHGIPISKRGDTIDPANPPVLADGVEGYAMEHGNALYIPLISAVVEGDGRVGKFLDSLPIWKTIKFPNVMSRRLAGMLERRGFHTEHDIDTSVYVRRGRSEKGKKQ